MDAPRSAPSKPRRIASGASSRSMYPNAPAWSARRASWAVVGCAATIVGKRRAISQMTDQSGGSYVATSRRIDCDRISFTPGTGLVRVGVIDSARTGAAYERLDECALDVMALVPSLGHVNLTLLHEYEVMLVGCSPEELDEAAFQTQLLRVARAVPAVAITPGGAGATTAARIGFHGFIAREVGPEALTRTVSAVAHGEVAFPRPTL